MKQEGFWQEKQTVSHEEEMPSYEKKLSYDEEIQNDLSYLVQNAQGRRFLKHLFAETGVFETIPIQNKKSYAYFEGKRSIGLALYHRLYALDPEHILHIQKQN
ncbi:MAG: hypothetical protein K2I05_00310 [Mailhella sp.]|nr:hypothetical protein [Mailhella sp.]